MRALRWLIFDVDGTLFDYDRAEAGALALAFADFGLPFDSDTLATYRAINDRLWRAFEQGSMDQSTLKVRRFAELATAIDAPVISPETMSDVYLRHLANGVDLIPGALRTVKALQPFFHLAVITNGLEAVQRPRLAGSALNGCFEVIVVSEEVGASKPQPEIFDLALAHMRHPDRQSVMIVGDSLTSDMQGGLNAGIHTCWFNPTGRRREPDLPVTFEIRRLSQLPGLVGRPELA